MIFTLEQEMEDDDQDNDDTSDEDIFFDCDEEDNQPESSIPIWSKEPVGRSKKLKQKLLQHDEFMYVPICQDPSPLTEDMLGMVSHKMSMITIFGHKHILAKISLMDFSKI